MGREARSGATNSFSISVNIAVYLVGYAPCLVLVQVTKLAQKCWEISKAISRCLDPRHETASRLIFLAPF